MQHVLVSWQANVNKVTLWKNIPLTLWLEIAHVTSQQESWVGKFNKYHKKNCTLPDTMRLCKADDFCDPPGHYPSPNVCWYIELISMTVLWTQRQAIVHSRRLLTQLCCISSLSWANCTQSSSRCMAIDHCHPLLVATGGSLLKARSTCVSQWQQYDLKPQAISQDLPTPSIPPIWDAKDTSTLVFFLHLLHS